MGNLRATTTWTRGTVHTKINGIGPSQTLSDFATQHIANVVNDSDNGTQHADTTGGPSPHTVVWTLDGEAYTMEVESGGTQADLDAAVAALKAAIAAAGGTVTSG